VKESESRPRARSSIGVNKGRGLFRTTITRKKRSNANIYKDFPSTLKLFDYGTYVFSRAGRNSKLQRGFGRIAL
jgi:hypothetical protein